ncbi:MAG: ABC transporter permease [Alphaproteobacteria bacterium]
MGAYFRDMPLSAVAGLVIVAVNVLVAVFGPVIAPYAESYQVSLQPWSPPSAEAWLGTDNLGRDMLTRMLYGAQTTLGIAFIATVLSFAVGIAFGFAAGTLGGAVDQVLSRIVDVFMAIPSLILSLLLLSILGTGVPVIISVIAVVDATRVFRISRALAMNLSVMEFVEAARLRGEGLTWVLGREILPNALPPLVAEFGLRFCFVILFVSSLSFLGLGIQPPYADWGGMVRDNAQAINFAAYDPLIAIAPLAPAVAIATLTVGINLLADWMLAKQNRTVGGQEA